MSANGELAQALDHVKWWANSRRRFFSSNVGPISGTVRPPGIELVGTRAAIPANQQRNGNGAGR